MGCVELCFLDSRLQLSPPWGLPLVGELLQPLEKGYMPVCEEAQSSLALGAAESLLQDCLRLLQILYLQGPQAGLEQFQAWQNFVHLHCSWH